MMLALRSLLRRESEEHCKRLALTWLFVSPLGVLLKASLVFQQHRKERLMCDVDVVKFEAVTYQRTLYRSGDQRAL